MNHLISKTINPKETILFIYGNLSEVARQFAEMLNYCKKKKLHVVDNPNQQSPHSYVSRRILTCFSIYTTHIFTQFKATIQVL